MSSRAVFIPIIITLIFGALLVGLISSCVPSTSTSLFGERVGLLYVDGIIMSGRSGDNPFFPSGGATSDHIVEVVNQAIDDVGVKALVVRINSPGGSAAASQEIYDVFEEFSDTGRPVIVSMADVAASGGYYIAAPADEIFANPATLTGSIGVIMQLMNYEGLYELIGLSDTTITSGELKDIGSPTRPMTDEEKELLQVMLDQVHVQFMDAVMEGRGFSKEGIEDIATGMIFNGEQALDLGLVDKLGGLSDALDRAADLAGLGDDYVVDYLGEVGLLEELLGDLSGVQSRQNELIQAAGVAGALGQALGASQNPFYSLWSMILLDPRLAGEGAGIRY